MNDYYSCTVCDAGTLKRRRAGCYVRMLSLCRQLCNSASASDSGPHRKKMRKSKLHSKRRQCCAEGKCGGRYTAYKPHSHVTVNMAWVNKITSTENPYDQFGDYNEDCLSIDDGIQIGESLDRS